MEIIKDIYKREAQCNVFYSIISISAFGVYFVFNYYHCGSNLSASIRLVSEPNGKNCWLKRKRCFGVAKLWRIDLCYRKDNYFEEGHKKCWVVVRRRQESKLARKHIIESIINGKKTFLEDYEGTKVFLKHKRKDGRKTKRYDHLRNSPIVVKRKKKRIWHGVRFDIYVGFISSCLKI